VGEVEEWLASLDPDEERSAPPERTWSNSGGAPPSIRLRALPKKAAARGNPGLIGNPVPAFAYWVDS